MTAQTEAIVATEPPRPSQAEFIALMAMLFATIAFSIDSMLPALPAIAADITPDAPNKAQLIVTSFMLGMGVGTLFTGPVSDSLGRKPVILGGAAIYILCSILASVAQSLEVLLAARVVQGLGAAGPRVVAMAIIRDQYSGRRMARIMSFVMLVFTLVPAFAPTMGAGIIWLTGWRGIFVSFVIFSVVGATWLALRQPETLPPSARRRFAPTQLARGVGEIMRHKVAARAITVQAFCYSLLFLTLSTTQMVFDTTFGKASTFHLWFGLIALVSSSASVVNAMLVERLGMRFLVSRMIVVQIGLTGIYCALLLLVDLPPAAAFTLYVLWVIGAFFQAGLTIGNLNALAMEPMGHLAGLTASVTGSVATIGAVILSSPVGLMFDGTPRPLAIGALGLMIIAHFLMRPLTRAPETE